MAGRTLQITYAGDAKAVLAAQRQIDAGHTKLQTGATKAGGTLKNVFGSVIPGATFLAAAGVGLAAKAIVDAATTEAEAQNQVNVIFGESVGVINKFAEQSATAAGISKGAALEAAGGFGAMLKSAGLAQTEAAKLSVSIVQLAGDLASFKNVAPEEALEKLRSGLAGEAEPLRQFGVFLSEAAVQAEAYKSGIASVGDELTEAQKVQARYNIILDQTTDAQGDFSETLGESLPNQLRALKAQVTDIAADFGTLLLPVLIQLVKVVGVLAGNIPLLVTAFGTFTAIKFLPPLLLQTASALASFGTGAAANGLLALSSAAGPIGLTVGAIVALGIAAEATSSTVGEVLTEAVGKGADVTERATEAYRRGVITQELYNKLVHASLDEVGAASQAAEVAQGRIANLTHTTAVAAVEARRFGHMSEEAFADFKESVVESVQVTVGEFAKLGDAFDTTPKELQKQLRLAVQIARTAQRDLREIFADKSLSDAQKEALADLPANQRHAWAEGGKAAKKQIEDDAVTLKRLSERTFREITSAAAKTAREGGQSVGASLDQGTITGIVEGSPAVLAAARKVIRDAIAAAKLEAGATSPSKVMAELGRNLMQGLANGIGDAEEKAIAAAGKAIDATIAAIEKRIDKLGSVLDKIRGRASEFGGGISGAIGGFGDIAGAFGSAAEEGTPLSAVLAAQLGGAQQLADVLDALKRQGAGKALLGQVAEGGAGFGQALLAGGPAQIQEANQALREIAELARETGKGLSEAFFGERIGRLEQKLDVLHDDLRREQQNARVVVHIGNVVGPGGVAEVTDIIRRELIRTGFRNSDIFGGRA